MPGVSRATTRWRMLNPDVPARYIAELLERAQADPDAALYAVADLERVAAWLVEEDADDAESEHGDYLHWLRRRARAHGGPWAKAVCTSRDVPIGLDAPERQAWAWIRQHAATPFPVGSECPELGPGMPAEALRALMPLPGVEYAAVVEPMGECGGALLCMCRSVERRYLSGGSWFGSQATSVPDGGRVEVLPVPARSISKTRQAEVRRWWRKVNGLPGGAGRPEGATFWTPERVVDALVSFVGDHGRKPRNREQFVIWAYHAAGLPVPTSVRIIGKRWSRQLAIPYPVLRDAIADTTDDVWIVDGEAGTEA